MAKRVTAINAYRTRIKRGPIVEPEELADFVADRENVSSSDVTHALLAIGDSALYRLRTGRSMRLMGLGMLTPSMDMEGNFSVRFVPDCKRLRGIAPPEKLYLAALWDAEHPYDPVEDA